MQPDDRGALHLARTYGPDLVCVRHRVDHNGRTRHTTVELLIASAPIQHRRPLMVNLKLDRNERELRAIILNAGGTWDPRLQLWSLPRHLAKILNLLARIVPTSR